MEGDYLVTEEGRCALEGIAEHLGVRRGGVTVVAAAIQAAGAISYRRGNLRVNDQQMLEGGGLRMLRRTGRRPSTSHVYLIVITNYGRGQTRKPLACLINQDLSHQACGNTQKVPTILPMNSGLLNQPQVSLIHQRRGLQEVTGFFPANVFMCELVQLVINHWN
jgi:hypothetical protein